MNFEETLSKLRNHTKAKELEFFETSGITRLIQFIVQGEKHTKKIVMKFTGEKPLSGELEDARVYIGDKLTRETIYFPREKTYHPIATLKPDMNGKNMAKYIEFSNLGNSQVVTIAEGEYDPKTYMPTDISTLSRKVLIDGKPAPHIRPILHGFGMYF